MIAFTALLLTCLGVTVFPGWSNPILVTDSANTIGRSQLINMDSQGRFHMVWTGFNDESRIGYKIFLQDGSTVYPETMISFDSHSNILLETVMRDSLIVFWTNGNLNYYCIRSMSDGSEITPATYIFSTSTVYPGIRACPDSLGRLHVLFNRGADVYYAVWTPAPGSGFITEREWKIEGADAGGVLLVDGNRVHIVVQDPEVHTYDYLQYDLDGNTVVPIRDFTADDLIGCGRYPELNLDSSGNLMVLESTGRSGQEYRFVLWKLNKDTGDTMIDEKVIVIGIPPVRAVSVSFILRALPGSEEFYLCWTIGQNYGMNKVFNLVMDEDGNVLVDWHIGYDYSDEDPEDVDDVDGVVDDEGNLYVVFAQVETEPQIDYFPTFGWFDHDFVGIENEAFCSIPPVIEFSISENPVHESVQFTASSDDSATLRVYDISGREVSEISISDGVGAWCGRDFTGARLPAGVYSVFSESGLARRITLLNR
jgi:hypothetical protein